MKVVNTKSHVAAYYRPMNTNKVYSSNYTMEMDNISLVHNCWWNGGRIGHLKRIYAMLDPDSTGMDD